MDNTGSAMSKQKPRVLYGKRQYCLRDVSVHIRQELVRPPHAQITNYRAHFREGVLSNRKA